MRVCRTIAALRASRRDFPILGLVPTMGYLHDGHLSLVRRAREENDGVVVSIFVNPTQFNQNEDLARYPRDLERDLALLAESGADLVFVPEVHEVYPDGFMTGIDMGELGRVLEGAARPGHFTGVATIVAKLLNIIQPERAYFGQKDAQQCAVIRRLAIDLSIPCEIVVAPTCREPDGLAMSSRNVYLSVEERRAATVLYAALRAAQHAFSWGERDAEKLRRIMQDVLAGEPAGMTDYVSVANALTMRELDRASLGDVASLAVRIGSVRLIDNIIFE